MRPILAIIPQLPAHLLLPLWIVTFLIAMAAVAYNLVQLRRPVPSNVVAASGANDALLDGNRSNDALLAALSPLIVAGVGCFLFFLWSHHSITLHSYGFFLVLGFFTATWNACLEAKRRDYDPNLILDIALPMLTVTVLMCRLLYVVLNLNQFHSVWEMMQIWSGGLSFHGAIIGGVLVSAYYSWSKKISIGALLDLMAPSVFLGYFFGRIGCLFNGCCYGKE
ncbi:MAG: prolipoprotein diacylglyceryl transferase, partial [Abitibacteriaceae bacterium]|nr:prolipoprotein diacylglyceryl transferase [Abditibacteriaceae bacterium]